jgi:hypothetical protein
MYTLQGETQPTRHTLCTLGSRMTLDHMYLTWSMYNNLSWSQQQRWTEPLLWSAFNTCSWGSTYRSLIDTDGGYKLGGAAFPHTTLRPFHPTVSTFHKKVTSGLQLNQALPNISKFKFKEHMTATWSFDHLAIYRKLQLRLAIANDLSLGIRSTWIDRKITLIQLGHQFNSYNLMRIQES